MTEPLITILLASYNGESFIAVQLESIINQTHKNWQLFIRDDGSSDNTLQIISSYQQSDLRIFFLKDDAGNLGSVQNFNALLQYKKKEAYIMFCDQDDAWLDTKIEDTLNEMMRLEKLYSSHTPLLVHTSFLYVDISLKPIESKKNYTATKIKVPVFANVLCQNSVHGCTMMINKKLADVTGIIPAEAENHDYWLALTASAFGKIFFLDKRTVLYRQHGSNLSTQHDFNSFTKRFKRILIDKKNLDDIKWKIKMALVFKKMYYEKLSAHNKKVVDDFISLYQIKSPQLFIRNAKNGIRRQTLSQTFLFYLTLLFSGKKGSAKSMVLLLIMFAAL